MNNLKDFIEIERYDLKEKIEIWKAIAWICLTYAFCITMAFFWSVK